MAARLNPKQDERTRNAIRTSQLVNRLQGFALSEPDPTSKKPIQMTGDQVRSALGLLAKTLPDLKAVEHSGDGVAGAFVLLGAREAKDAGEWVSQHTPRK